MAREQERSGETWRTLQGPGRGAESRLQSPSVPQSTFLHAHSKAWRRDGGNEMYPTGHKPGCVSKCGTPASTAPVLSVSDLPFQEMTLSIRGKMGALKCHPSSLLRCSVTGRALWAHTDCLVLCPGENEKIFLQLLTRSSVWVIYLNMGITSASYGT